MNYLDVEYSLHFNNNCITIKLMIMIYNFISIMLSLF